MENSIHVILWGEEIGILAWNNARKLSYFTFNPNWKTDSVSPFPRVKYNNKMIPIWGEYSPWGQEHQEYQYLPTFIADSLPDRWGNQLYEKWLTYRNINPNEVTPLEKLSFIGKRGMGALEFIPEIKIINEDEKIDIGEISRLAEEIYTERTQAVITAHDNITQQSLISLGSSLGGRFPKAVIAINKSTGDIRSGQVEGLADYDYNIIKFSINQQYPSTELEMAYYKMAVDSGIEMMPSELINIDGRNHFMTRRFDRVHGEKVHTQTIAAIDPEVSSYEGLIRISRNLGLPEKDCEEIYRRLVFNYLSNNTDDHKRNFTLMMNKGGRWRLSPAYDMNYIANKYDYSPLRDHEFTVMSKRYGLSLQEVLSFAKNNDIKQPHQIIQQVAEVLRNFRIYAESSGFNSDYINTVEECINSHLKEWGLEPSKVYDNIINIDGIVFVNPKIETNLKGDVYCLSASVNGNTMKQYIRKNSPWYQTIADDREGLTKSGKMIDLIKFYFVSRINSVPRD